MARLALNQFHRQTDRDQAIQSTRRTLQNTYTVLSAVPRLIFRSSIAGLLLDVTIITTTKVVIVVLVIIINITTVIIVIDVVVVLLLITVFRSLNILLPLSSPSQKVCYFSLRLIRYPHYHHQCGRHRRSCPTPPRYYFLRFFFLNVLLLL